LHYGHERHEFSICQVTKGKILNDRHGGVGFLLLRRPKTERADQA